MKCIVPGVNLKVFGRAIHSLAKIGDEIYFEPLEQGLSLRTVNSSRSAYACFVFFPSYFQHYDDGKKQTREVVDDEEEEGLRCKITMKSIMAVFRSLSSIEKTVEKCKIMHNAKEARLVFELHCRHGIVKKHNLAYIECETLQAMFSKDMCPNKLTAPPKLLCEVVVNFQAAQEEITLTVHPEALSLKNYVEDEPDPNKVVHTELNLAPEEFDKYQVGVDTEITFCLKELRAILAFAETTGLPLNINFESAGRPVTFCIDSDQTFEANFVLATLAEADQTSSQMPPSQRSQRTSSTAPNTSKHGAAPSKTGSSRETSSNASALVRSNADKDHCGRRQNKHQDQNMERPSTSNMASRDGGDEEEDALGDISAEDLAAAMEVEQEWEEAERKRQTDSGQTEDRERGSQRVRENGEEGSEDCSPVIPVQCATGDKKRPGSCLQPVDNDDDEEEDNFDDTIPGTPPSTPPAKKFRSLFFGSSQASTQPPDTSAVLAADTDDEED